MQYRLPASLFVYLILMSEGSLTPSIDLFASAHVFGGGGGRSLGKGIRPVTVGALLWTDVSRTTHEGAVLNSAFLREVTAEPAQTTTKFCDISANAGNSLSRRSRSLALSVSSIFLYSPTDRRGRGGSDDILGFGGKFNRCEHPLPVGATKPMVGVGGAGTAVTFFFTDDGRGVEGRGGAGGRGGDAGEAGRDAGSGGGD